MLQPFRNAVTFALVSFQGAEKAGFDRCRADHKAVDHLLDEPTSGRIPAAEERIMKLFRQIAEAGRTVILTTHAMEKSSFSTRSSFSWAESCFLRNADEALDTLRPQLQRALCAS